MKLVQGRVKLKRNCGLNTRGVVISFVLEQQPVYSFVVVCFFVQTTILKVYITVFTVYLQIISIEYLTYYI